MNALTRPINCYELQEWFEKKQLREVIFSQNFNPELDRWSDYKVISETFIKPNNLMMARVEIWLTNDSRVAIGIENRSRIAARLEVSCMKNIFASGHEPQIVNKKALFCLLDCISTGKLGISSFSLPFVGLINTNAVMLRQDYELLLEVGYPDVTWIKIVPSLDKSNIVRFEPWN